MAKAKFLLQGQSEKENHRIAFEQLKSVGDIQEVIVSTAFLNSEGVEVIKEDLNNFKGNMTIYVGNRNGITSVQGVNGLLDMGIKPYLVDTGVSTFIFHPKTYLACSNVKAMSIVGSANLTLGGLVKNIEASDVLELDIANDENDRMYVESIKESFTNLRMNHPYNVIQVKNKEEAENLLKEGKLIDESAIKHHSMGLSSSQKKTITPSMKTNIENVSDRLTGKKRCKRVQAATTTVSTSQVIGLHWLEVWESKPLKERDLNIPTGVNTHATGSMTLKKGEYENIDQRTYFRNIVFNKLDWERKATGTKSHLEYAKADFYVVVEGINFGKYTLELKHDPRTNTASYSQNNAMTHLLWKDAKQFIANRNLLGKKLRIYEIVPSNNEFVIEISEAETDLSVM